MARKVTCPHCRAETYDTPSCGRCGGNLRGPTPGSPEALKVELEELRKEAINKFSMVSRAQQIHENLSKVVLATFKAIQLTEGVSVEGTQLVVDREKRQFVYTSTEGRGVRLGPGRYSYARVIVAGGGRGKTPKDVGALICEVSEAPINVTFAFPDYDSFGETLRTATNLEDEKLLKPGLIAIDQALMSLSLRTSDDRLGGALLQLRVECADPIKLVRCRDANFADDPDSDGNDSKPDVKPSKSLARDPAQQLMAKGRVRTGQRALNEPDKPWLQRAWEWFYGHERKTQTTYHTRHITMADLFSMIRYELADAVGNAIHNVAVAALYDREDSNRDRLHESLKQYMQKTLEGYGLKILDVVAFQFRSPEYEEFLKQRGDLTLERRRLEEIEREESALRHDRRELHHDENKHVEQLEEEKDLLGLDRKARFGERADQITMEEARRADQLAAEQQERHLTMDQRRLEFERRQLEAEDARQHKQALHALEYHERLQEQQMKLAQQAQNADHNRRLEAVKLIAGFPAEQQFLLAMQYNPELQQAFIAMQHAQSNEDKVQLAQQFQGQVQQIYGDQSDQTNALLIEAAKALGLAVSARVHDQAPPLQVKVEHVSNRGPQE